MKELEQSLREAEETSDHGILLRAAVHWSEYVLTNNVGKLLNTGLQISKALAEYDALLKNPEQDLS